MLERDEIDFSIFSDEELSMMKDWNKGMLEVYITSKNLSVLDKMIEKHPRDKVLIWIRKMYYKLRRNKNGSARNHYKGIKTRKS